MVAPRGVPGNTPYESGTFRARVSRKRSFPAISRPGLEPGTWRLGVSLDAFAAVHQGTEMTRVYVLSETEPLADRSGRRPRRGTRGPSGAPVRGALAPVLSLAGSRPLLPFERRHAPLASQRRSCLRVSPQASRTAPEHALIRHVCATLLLGGNVHPKYVPELPGSSSIALTLDTCSHVRKGIDCGIGGAMYEALG